MVSNKTEVASEILNHARKIQMLGNLLTCYFPEGNLNSPEQWIWHELGFSLKEHGESIEKILDQKEFEGNQKLK